MVFIELNDSCFKLSDSISSRLLAASRVNQTPSLVSSAVATFPPDMGTMSVPPVMPLGPTVCMGHASLTSLVTHPVLIAWRTHRHPWSSEEPEQYGEASSVHRKGVWGSNPSFITRSITHNEYSFVALCFAQRPPNPSHNIHFTRRSTFLRHAMSDVTTFAR
ncbi:hypothetical protein D8674_028612 [Pyrus ussuriensis x Pyrus communis]|uniref:Uncharacterized protein n=1 Tax=Pyrus ussuriensis x Pyrus communis TaxID=2448454 RepID=A0A5N5HWR9_9ROSA|nr:hypothetical protein D8674_028612 [Pyrus ussuriensis x Pyrus communis]